MYLSSPESTFILFADDTNVFISDKDPSVLESKVNNVMSAIKEFTLANGLSLNVKKTHFMLFCPNKSRKHHDMRVSLCDKPLIRVKSTKFLGLIIEDTLSWSTHIKHVSTKIATSLGLMCKARKVLYGIDLIPLYYAYIFPYLIYALPVWGGSPNLQLYEIIKFQKRAIRLISNIKYKESITNAFYKLGMLKLPELYVYYLALFMYKSVNNLIPEQFCSFYRKNSEMGIRTTRQAQDLQMPKLLKPMTQLNVRLKGVIIWKDILAKTTFECPISAYKQFVAAKLFEFYSP